MTVIVERAGAPRIAVGGFMHETNTFAPTKACLDAFEHGGGWPALVEGPAVFEALRDVNMGLCGFIEEAGRQDWALQPTLWCAASPSAHVTEDAFETIAVRILKGIKAALPLDGVYLDLHGAIVTDHCDDGEGELLTRGRDQIGPVAAFKLCKVVDRLPKTRSGKILRGTMVKIADSETYKMPATIDDPAILDEIKDALQPLGYAK